MCESTAYLITKDGTIPIMESVIFAIPRENGEVFLEDILGDQKTVRGKLKEIKLLDHKILIEEI